jgi:hypothetical protein
MEGALADKSHSLVLDALARAAAEPRGLPLLASKAAAGLFAANAAGKEAARHSKNEELIRVLREETKGKSTQEICVLTEKGLGLLLEQANPRRVLEAFVNALEVSQQQMTHLLESARANQEQLLALKAGAEMVLQQLQRPQVLTPRSVERNGKHAGDGAAALVTYLTRRHEKGALDDCPLPELFRHLRSHHSGLTTGQFHDLLVRLVDDGTIYLHPWTGPLYELPEPACALLVGHEVAYYASLRKTLSPDT